MLRCNTSAAVGVASMEKPPVLAAMKLRPALHERLAARYELHGPLERSAPDAIPEVARGARALITLGGYRTDGPLMDALPNLGLISCYGTGFEGVDRAAAAARGIAVTHAGDSNATSVAEFAMGLVIATARKILAGDRFIREGRWVTRALDRLSLVPGLAGRRLGIYGLGSIGLRIARRAEAFEMEIGYHNRSPRADLPYAYHASLPELAAWCDVLVVAVRADASNRHAVGAEVLEALGRDGILVNISRGIAVDETALCDALEAGRIAGAGLDVFEEEPHVPERLKALENVVLTPHIAATAQVAQEAQQQLIVDNLEAFFAGRPVRSKVPGVS
jgi:lactate dehydrogenase-like 2-hydroxyacid dehydrogenase